MKVITESVNQTLRLGRKIAKSLQKGDIICLFGELGSGKTVLTKGIAQGLGIKRNNIISPSFVLIRSYLRAKLPLYHFDLYRLKIPKDILDLGYQEYIYDDAVTVIEWADRLGYLLPPEYLKVELFIRPDSQRLFKFSGIGKRYKELLRSLKNNIARDL